MLKVDESAQQRMHEAREEAARLGLTDQLASQLDILNKLYDLGDGKTECVLSPDFAPFSFHWVVWRFNELDKEPVIAGGLIYHDGESFSGGYPTYSVSLSNERGWQIHT